MSYSSGDSFGYDQIQPNMQLDNYDSPYTTIAPSPNLPGRRAGPSASCANERPYRTFLPPTGPRWPIAEAVNPKPHYVKSSCPYMERRVPLDTDVAILQGLTSGGSATSRMLSRLDIGKDDANFILILFIIILTMSLIINNVNMRHLTKQVKLLRQGSLAKLPIS